MARRPNEVRGISGLPKWFDLAKYADAKKLDAAGWWEQLLVRRNCFVWLEPWGVEAHPRVKRPSGPVGGLLGEVLAEIRKAPIVSVTKSDLFWDVFFDDRLPKPDGYCRRLRHPQGIRRATAGSLKKAEAEARRDSTTAPRTKTAIFVDLRLPDGLLLDAFAQWLSSKRGPALPAEKTSHYRQSDFGRWVRFGVLPFLDLTLWATEERKSIPDRVMADAIYGLLALDADTVRKTTAPLARRLIGFKSEPEEIRRLAAVAAQRVAAKSEESSG